MLKKYPFVRQSNLKDCGVSCLKMIIQFYNGYVPTNLLQEWTKTNKNGTTAYHIIETAKKIGFEAYGVSASIKDINEKNMILPCIVNVTINKSYNHYLVIYNIDYKKKLIVIADPANKIKKISFEEFEKIWNKVIIFMYPKKIIPKYSEEKFINNFLKEKIFENKKSLIYVTILSLLFTCLSVLTSYNLKFFINEKTKSKLLITFILFSICIIIKIITDLFRNTIINYINEKVELSLNSDVFKNIINLPYNYYRNHTTGEITSRINDLEKIRDFISKALLIIIDIPISAIASVILFKINKTMFFFTLFIVISYSLTSFLFLPFFKNKIEKSQILRADYQSFMIESITNFESIKSLSIENKVSNIFNNKLLNFVKNIFSMNTLYNIEKNLQNAIYELGIIILTFIGCNLILKNELTIGNLLVINSLFNYLLMPLKNIIDYSIILKEIKNACIRINEIIIKNKDNAIIKKEKIENIKIKNLNFSYDNSEIILKNINLKIDKGQKIMIIGSSGSGKSTLFKILLKYHSIKRNIIYLNEKDINDYKKTCLQSNIVYISQNENIFTDTIKNNIEISNTSNDFIDICKMCYIDEIIKDNKLGYNMMLEENGFNISGGEKQRIVLARALNNNFEILLIDEGLNQVDVSLERKILKNLFEKYKDKTIIIISHRTDNLDLFDRLIEFKDKTIYKDVKKNDFNRSIKFEKLPSYT